MMAKREAQIKEILEKTKSMSNPKAIEGIAKFGITTKKTYGVYIHLPVYVSCYNNRNMCVGKLYGKQKLNII